MGPHRQKAIAFRILGTKVKLNSSAVRRAGLFLLTKRWKLLKQTYFFFPKDLEVFILAYSCRKNIISWNKISSENSHASITEMKWAFLLYTEPFSLLIKLKIIGKLVFTLIENPLAPLVARWFHAIMELLNRAEKKTRVEKRISCTLTQTSVESGFQISCQHWIEDERHFLAFRSFEDGAKTA